MMATGRVLPSVQSKSKAKDRWFLVFTIGLASVSLTGLLFALSFVGLLSLDFLIAVPLALAGMASAVLLFHVVAALFASAAEGVDIPSAPRPA